MKFNLLQILDKIVDNEHINMAEKAVLDRILPPVVEEKITE